MKIATWNIGEDETKKDGRLDISSYEYITKIIKEKEIDVLCLQEAIIKSNYIPAIAEYIKENTDLKYNVQYELSDSLANIGCRMGVAICSKFEINNYELFMLDNPRLTYKVNENITRYSHDKGFIISSILNYKIICGHCLPFHAFKKNVLDYIEIFNKADKKFISEFYKNNNFILCGDFNYDNVDFLFPKVMEHSKDYIESATRKDKQSDYIILVIILM